MQLLIDSLLFCYREEQHRALVIKEVWTLEIAYSLLERFKDRVKIIAILRDPADIVSSSKTNAGNYPLLYLVRHWRKNIAIARHLKQEHPAQVHLLGYEELCEKPLKKYNEMIGHILPTNNNSALDILPIPREDNGALFVKNSSYKQKTNAAIIDRKSVGKYKTTLTTSEKNWLKYLCNITYLGNLNFESLNYDSSTPFAYESLGNYPARDNSTVAHWFKESYPEYDTKHFLDVHLSRERERFQDVITSTANSMNSIINIIKQV